MTSRLAFVAGVLTEVRAPGLPSDLAAHGPDAVDAPGCGGVGDPRRQLPGGIDRAAQCSLAPWNGYLGPRTPPYG